MPAKTIRPPVNDPSTTHRHLLGLEGMRAAAIVELLDLAETFLPVDGHPSTGGGSRHKDLLAHRTIANLFFEDSTRTRSSFTIAARRLGADTLDIASAGSSVVKGETIVDTALNLAAMGVDAFVVRCSASGGPHMIANAVSKPVINAGDGRHEHPTQGLLDLLTLRQRLGELRGKTIGIVGDVLNSRVARSDVHGLTALGCNVTLCGPPPLVPRSFEKITAAQATGRVRIAHDLDSILGELDAIIMLRVQFERSDGPALISGDYRQLYGLNASRAAQLPPHAVIMHPGPLNRGLEIDSDVADDPRRSAILQQAGNGVAVRMAVLATLLQ